MRHMHSEILSVLGVAVFAAVAPLLMPVNIANEILVLAVFAMGTSLVIGSAGLYSFGQATFLGAGAYVSGYLLARLGVSTPTGLLAGAAAGAASALLVGAVSLRRTGFYFMMLTFAFNQMAFYLVLTWSGVTGGEDGLTGVRRPAIRIAEGWQLALDDRRVFYGLCALLFVASYAVLSRVRRSALGLVLQAAQENPRRVASLGYSVFGAQLMAFTVAGAFCGLAGAMYTLLYRLVPVDVVSGHMAGNVVFMVIIGGVSSMFGPVIGAAAFVGLQGLFSLIWARWALLFGLFIMLVVFTMPGGLTGLARQWMARRRARPSAKDGEAEAA